RTLECPLLLLLRLLQRRQQLLGRGRAGDHSVVRIEQVPLCRCPLVGECSRLRRVQQVEETAHRDRNVLQAGGHRGTGQVVLEVVELQDGRLPDQLRRGG